MAYEGDQAHEARALVRALSMPAPPEITQPWEEGIFKEIFGNEDEDTLLVIVPRQLLPKRSEEVEKFVDKGASQAPSALIQRRSALKSWAQTGHAARDRAIERWKLIIMSNPRASVVGRNLVREASVDVPADTQQLEDVFAVKATGTLAKRAGPILKFMAWCHNLGIEALPLQEEHVYRFLSEGRGTQAATFAGQLIESCTFAHHIVGLDGADA
eukprot:6464683-Amphidinium_carterae.1